MSLEGVTVIAAGTVVRGDLEADLGLEILGRIEGNVLSQGEVVIFEAGFVLGNVQGGRVVVSGEVEGNLKGDELVAVESPGRVTGDLLAPSVSVAPGAKVKGEVRTLGESGLALRRTPARTKRDAEASARRGAELAHAEALEADGLRSLGAAELGVARPLPSQGDEEVETPRRLVPLGPAAFRDADDPEETATIELPLERKGPPPPQLPQLAKGAKAKKKGKRG